MSNLIDSIQLSGTVYTIQGSGGGGVPESTFTAYTASTDARISEDEEVTAAGLNALNEAISGISGNNVVELTQDEYDALVDKDPTAFYIITDATPIDVSNYWTSAQTQSAITSAVSTKQDTLQSGTNIKTINNESLLGSGNIDIQGGGKAIEAGRGISITTGETADTVSFNLPISAGTGSNSIVEGYYLNKASGQYSHAEGVYTECKSSASHAEGQYTKALGSYSHSEGYFTTANTESSHASGRYTKTTNRGEYASGEYNKSVSGSSTFGDSGNTVFSVGNGTADNARHNAFEIRQNGDIYITKDGQDVKLQDQLGGGSITVDTALDSGSTNPVENRVIYNKIDEVEQVTAAGLNAVNDKFDGMKLKKISQTDYDNLQTKDSSTLYIIVN